MLCGHIYKHKPSTVILAALVHCMYKLVIRAVNESLPHCPLTEEGISGTNEVFSDLEFQLYIIWYSDIVGCDSAYLVCSLPVSTSV